MSWRPAASLSRPAAHARPATLLRQATLLVLAILLALIVLTSTVRASARTPEQEATRSAIQALWTAGLYDSCWARIGAELRNARAHGDSSSVLDLLAERGHGKALLGRIREAEPDLQAAIRMAETAGNGETLRSSLRWFAYTLGREGRSPEALQEWSRLLALSLESGDRPHEAWARVGIGFIRWQEGHAREAGGQYERALKLFREQHDPRGEPYALNGLGTVAQNLGDYTRAEELYREAAAGARASSWIWLEALAWNNIATLRFSLGDPGEARELFRKAADLHRQAGDLAEAALTGMNVAECDAALGAFEEGVVELQRIRDDCHAHGIGQLDGNLCNALAETRHSQGRLHAALALFRETLAKAESTNAGSRLNAVLGIARTLAEVDSLDEASHLLTREASRFHGGDPLDRVEYELALGQCHLRAGRAGEAFAAFTAAEKEADRLGQRAPRIQALSGAAQAAWKLGRPDSSLAYMHAALTIWETERGLPADPAWREIRGSTAAEVIVTLGSLLLEYPPSTSPADRARAAFDAVQMYKARTLMERMLGPAGEETPALTISGIPCSDLQRSVLRPGELLLDFYVGSEASLVFAVSDEECRAYRIPGRKDLEAALLPYVRMISLPEDNEGASGTRIPDLRAVHARVRELLLGPVLDMVARERSLIVIPDGILDRVSFAALLDDDTDRAPATSPILQIAPSAAIFAQLRTEGTRIRDARSGPSAILALAGPEEGWSGSWNEAGQEVRDLAAHFRRVDLAPSSARDPSVGAVSSDTSAERKNVSTDRDSASADRKETDAPPSFLASLARYDVLHLAAHATVDEEHPWCGRIHLTDRASAGRGIALTASAITHSRLPARLVVLSTCRSAGGRVLPGEGVQGPASAFLVAGVPSVVASLWPVDGARTRQLMRRFYEALATGTTVAEALSKAQADLRRDPRSSHPFNWAGFVVLGDGDLRVPLERKSPLGRFAVPIVLILAGAMALVGMPLSRRIPRHSAVIPRSRVRSRDDAKP